MDHIKFFSIVFKYEVPFFILYGTRHSCSIYLQYVNFLQVSVKPHHVNMEHCSCPFGITSQTQDHNMK